MSSLKFISLSLWIASICSTCDGCPLLCTCSDKGSQFHVICPFKGFTEVPPGIPSNVTVLTLTANKIRVVRRMGFQHLTKVMSLWLSNNKIATIERGTVAHLVLLRNLDVSNNRIVDFPWEDLRSLTHLQLLKMNHNNMTHLPKDALSTLKELRSLHLNNNKFVTIAEGTFAGLVSLSYLPVFQNPFVCTCALDWLRAWITTTTVDIPEDEQMICESPEKFRGQPIKKIPALQCASAKVLIRTQPFSHNPTLNEGSTLILTCEFSGSPRPLVMWSIHSQRWKQELALPLSVDYSGKSSEVFIQSRSDRHVKVFDNGTLVMSHIQKDDSGNYSCSATNEFARAEDSLTLTVLALPKSTPTEPVTKPFTTIETLPQTTLETAVVGSPVIPELKDLLRVVASPMPITDNFTENKDAITHLSREGKCILTANTRNVSSLVFNKSLDEVKHNTFDFGVIAFGTSETEASVRLNPLLIPQHKRDNLFSTNTSASLSTANNDETHGQMISLSLCITEDRTHTAVQWSRIKEGIDTYTFSGLRPGTNYSLCLTRNGDDCVIQVIFATKKRVPNFLIIISVSICLLTVSTVPLIGATCFHLVYKYRSKTYKLILKAKDQCHMESTLTANFNMHAPHAESRRVTVGSQQDEEGGETESGDGEQEADTEESVMTESLSFSHCRAGLDNCEVESECSDRLPLGAEAVNIVSNYKYPNE